ncbi:MAG: amino acid adenylation domain-containing protein [Candidatus Aminicenantes bacterium]|jgi:amino acid adenylation domain-containing protein
MKRIHYSDQAAVAANQNIVEKTYWLETLAGERLKSHFPYDHKGFENETGQNAKIAVETFRFPGDLLQMAMKVSSGIDLKLHMVLVSGLMGLLEKYTAAGDIIIGSPILKQEQEADFVNTLLVFRTRLSRHMTFRELLMRVKETIITATQHQNFPLEVLPELLNLSLPENSDEFPLFDVALLLENVHDRAYLKGIHGNMLFSFRRTAEHIKGNLEYNSFLYHEQTVKQVINHYIRFLQKGLADLSRRFADIDILSKQEKHRLLMEFNANAVEYPEDKTLHGLFAQQVEKTPDQVALIGQNPRQEGTRGLAPLFDHVSICYRELNKKSDQLACALIEKGIQPDTIVGIMVERCVELIIGIFAILKAGGAYLPIHPDYPEERLQYMLKDSNAQILVVDDTSSASWLSFGPEVLLNVSEGHHLNFTASQLPSFTASLPTNLAYIIYTSGSTGKPKAVMVEHGNVVANLFAFYKEFEITGKDTVIQLTTFVFDAFVEEVFPVLLRGGKIVIPHGEQRLDIDFLSDFILKQDVSIIDCSPLLLKEFNRLGISSVHIIISGGDVLRKEYVGNFLASGNVYNTYGPTEATICSTYYRCSPRVPAAIPIGKPIANYIVYILDANDQLQPIGVTGELSISGPGITRGYLNKPELTAQKFDHDLWDYQDYHDEKQIERKKSNEKLFRGVQGGGFLEKSPPGRRRQKLYKTGDRVRWLPDGNIEFLGRMDNQIKIRGYRIELGEIENKLLEHKDIKEAVVVEKTEETGDKYLCGYIVSDRQFNASELREYLGQKLPDYMVPWFFIQMHQLPLTPNGKIDRKTLPDPQGTGEKEYVAPRNRVEKNLVPIWSRVLGVETDNIGIDTDFFDLGGNSLKAIVMSGKIHKKFNAKVSLTDIFKLQTIRNLAEFIKGAGQDIYTSIEPAAKKEYYPLSSAQKRIYIVQQLDPESTGYNMPLTVVWPGDPEKKRLEESFKKLIQRHEMLRTSFEIPKDDPMQRVHETDEVEFRMEYYETSEEDARKLLKDFVRPFNLKQAPLMKASLLNVNKNIKTAHHTVLAVDMHHIISDEISHAILKQDFVSLYEGRELPPLRIQYRDFSLWQNSQRIRDTIKQQEAFWLKEFEGEMPVLAIDSDYPRPALQDFEGNTVTFRIEKENTKKIKACAAHESATLQMVLLAIFNILLYKISGQEDIIVGSSVTGRRHADLENVIGMFANALALRNFPSGEKNFRTFLKEVKENSLNAYENQDYPFENLVANILTHRDAGHHPLFDVMFEIQEMNGNPGKETVKNKQEKREGKSNPLSTGK